MYEGEAHVVLVLRGSKGNLRSEGAAVLGMHVTSEGARYPHSQYALIPTKLFRVSIFSESLYQERGM